jgi:hypothetical protein
VRTAAGNRSRNSPRSVIILMEPTWPATSPSQASECQIGSIRDAGGTEGRDVLECAPHRWRIRRSWHTSLRRVRRSTHLRAFVRARGRSLDGRWNRRDTAANRPARGNRTLGPCAPYDASTSSSPRCLWIVVAAARGRPMRQSARLRWATAVVAGRDPPTRRASG